MAVSFHAETFGVNGFAVRGPVAASPEVGAALIDAGSNRLEWTDRAVLVEPAVVAGSDDDYLSPTGWKSLIDSIGYTPANDANVLHKTGNETKTGNLTINGIVTGQELWAAKAGGTTAWVYNSTSGSYLKLSSEAFIQNNQASLTFVDGLSNYQKLIAGAATFKDVITSDGTGDSITVHTIKSSLMNSSFRWMASFSDFGRGVNDDVLEFHSNYEGVAGKPKIGHNWENFFTTVSGQRIYEENWDYTSIDRSISYRPSAWQIDLDTHHTNCEYRVNQIEYYSRTGVSPFLTIHTGDNKLTVGGALVVNKSASQFGYHSLFSGAIGAGEIGLYVLPASTGDGATAYYTSLGNVTGSAYGFSAVASASNGIYNQLRNTGGFAANIIWASTGNDAYTYHLSGSQELSVGLDSSAGSFVISQAGDLNTPRFSVNATSGNATATGTVTSGEQSGTNGSFNAVGANSNTFAKSYAVNSDAFLKLNSGGSGNYRGIRFGYGASTEDWLLGYFGTYAAGDIGLYGPFGAHHFAASGAVTFGGNISGNQLISSTHVYADGQLQLAGNVRITSSGDGVVLLLNNASSGFNRIALGGMTSGFPSIKRNGTVIDFRLADDSDYTGIIAAGSSFTGDVTGTAFVSMASGDGRCTIRKGDGGHTGYVEFLDASLNRTWYMGYGSTNNELNLVPFDASYVFALRGDILAVGGSANDTRWNRTGTGAASLQAYYAAGTTWQTSISWSQSSSGAKVAFLGATPIVRQTVSAAATDAATTQSLVNELRQLVIDFGLAV